MRKKTGSHVDWVISIGIFLTYLLTLFIFLKPGVIPVHDTDVLLSIVEDNFKSDTYWTLYTTPIFFKEEYTVVGCIIMDFNFTWPENKITLYDPNNIGSPLAFELTGTSSERKLIFDSTGEKEYTLHFSEDDIYETLSIQSLCGDSPTESIDPVTENINFIYHYGITESLESIDIDIKCIGLEGKYDELKTNWGYPFLKEFKVQVYEDIANPLCEFGFEDEPPTEVSVYTRQWSDFILKQNGTRMPVTVNVLVW